MLAWVLYLLGDKLDTISPLIQPRVQREIDARILTPLLERDDFWWMGFDGAVSTTGTRGSTPTGSPARC